VLAEGIRDAYQDLFKVNTKAHELGKQEVINKFKTLGQGQISEPVLDKMAMTFTALTKQADFQSLTIPSVTPAGGDAKAADDLQDKSLPPHAGIKLGGLVYNIQIVLPESRDAAVYDALFQSLKRHLL
jgi:hypothetical protein